MAAGGAGGEKISAVLGIERRGREHCDGGHHRGARRDRSLIALALLLRALKAHFNQPADRLLKDLAKSGSRRLQSSTFFTHEKAAATMLSRLIALAVFGFLESAARPVPRR